MSRNGKTVLAATPDGIRRSVDAARSIWTTVLAGPVADIKCHPLLSTRAVAGGLDNGQAWFSSNSGRTWKPASHAGAWSGRVELAYARKNPNIVYASVEGEGGSLWQSTDGGKTYQRRRAARRHCQSLHRCRRKPGSGCWGRWPDKSPPGWP